MEGQIYYNCADERVQTGQPDCIKKENKTTDLLISSVNALYPTDPDAFNELMNAEDGYLVTDGTLRLTSINDVRLTANNGGDVATDDIGYGETAPVTTNGLSQVFRINGGVCLAKQLMALDKKSVRVFRVDDENAIFGTIVKQNGVDYFAGYKATLSVREVPATGTESYYIETTVYYSPNYEKERKAMHSFMLDSVPTGLIPITLQKGTGTGTAMVVQSCNGENITSRFTGWAQTMFETEDGTNPTSVTANGGLLTFDPVGSYRVLGAQVLAAGDILGVEGIRQFINLA